MISRSRASEQSFSACTVSGQNRKQNRNTLIKNWDAIKTFWRLRVRNLWTACKNLSSGEALSSTVQPLPRLSARRSLKIPSSNWQCKRKSAYPCQTERKSHLCPHTLLRLVTWRPWLWRYMMMTFITSMPVMNASPRYHTTATSSFVLSMTSNEADLVRLLNFLHYKSQ